MCVCLQPQLKNTPRIIFAHLHCSHDFKEIYVYRVYLKHFFRREENLERKIKRLSDAGFRHEELSGKWETSQNIIC